MKPSKLGLGITVRGFKLICKFFNSILNCQSDNFFFYIVVRSVAGLPVRYYYILTISCVGNGVGFFFFCMFHSFGVQSSR